MNTELVTTLKRQATRNLSDLDSSHDPVLITEHGKPSACLIDIDTYELLQDRIRILEGIALGENAIRDSNTFTHTHVKKRMK